MGKSMSNIMLFGAGRMGQVIAHAMERLGHSVSIADTSLEALNLIRQDCKDYKTYHINSSPVPSGHGFISADDLKEVLSQSFDLVISALPYYATKKVAKACIENEIPYCDLGGSVPVSDEINKYSKEAKKGKVFTDLGLAPGLVNILAESGYNELGGAENVSMMVGGLPNVPSSNPLGYTVTWSIDGLINEYKDDCEILEDGKIKIVSGLDGLEHVPTRLGELEAFYTSGGASHTITTMQERGVKNCSYKTLRYLGHNSIVKFLIRDCDLTKECLTEIFEKGCNTDDNDIIIVRAVVELGSVSWKKEFIIYSDEKFTAMQKATAFSLSAAADLIARGKISTDTHSINYRDIPFELFLKNLNLLGIEV